MTQPLTLGEADELKIELVVGAAVRERVTDTEVVEVLHPDAVVVLDVLTLRDRVTVGDLEGVSVDDIVVEAVTVLQYVADTELVED